MIDEIVRSGTFTIKPRYVYHSSYSDFLPIAHFKNCLKIPSPLSLSPRNFGMRAPHPVDEGPGRFPHAKEGKRLMYAIRSHVIGRAVMAFVVLAPIVLISAPVLGKEAQSYVGNAQSYAAKGDLKAAEIELRNALREAPQDAHIHAMLGQIYLTLGEFASAEREARSARDLKADEADY